jgi:large subunit ribosomal protein L9
LIQKFNTNFIMRRTTEVILTHNIVGLGAESDQVKVAPGYARNYLLPQGLAIPLSAGNKRRIESLRQRRAEREAHELNTMTELAKSLGKLVCLIKVKTGDDGKIFGSVTNGTIADELKHQFDVTLEKRKINLEHPIKALGEYDVDLNLHTEVKTTLKIRVESLNPAPEKTAESREEGPRTEKRGRRPDRNERKIIRAGGVFVPEEAPAADKPAKAERPRKAKAEKAAE